MEIITYRDIEEDIKRTIEDHFAKQGLIAKDLGRQIFEKYDYKPLKAPILENRFIPRGSRLYDGIIHGIDDIIQFDDIPEKDSLNLKQTIRGKWNYYSYSIDYKSINLRYNNSIYVKLMNYHSNRQYLAPYKKENGKIIDPVARNMRIDENIAMKYGRANITSNMANIMVIISY